MVSYEAMNMKMSSPVTQFGPAGRMGIYEQFHQMSVWEDTLRSDIIPCSGDCMVTQADDKSEYMSNESVVPSGSGDNQGDNQAHQAGKGIADKAQRRLAQNREAARKSRLRKKAYIQQLEMSRLKLAQLELEIEKTRHQGVYMLGPTTKMGMYGTINPGIVAFEMEYAHWVEEQQKKISELRSILLSNTSSDVELQLVIENVLNHYYELFRMRAEVAKADVFYLLSGMWRTSLERFFLWIGGFRPSELINAVMPQLEPLADEQLFNVCSLRDCCQQAEEALTQGMDKLQQSLAQSMASMSTDAVIYGSQMSSAMEKLESIESFVNQADNLRKQTLQQMSSILTTHQAARGLLAFGEYFQRLHALSSLWAARPREMD
ncbi:PREDICTED: transcription factor TGA7-like isoform X2 [Ipomoea nil]|uniref:transcription factor TGA7-like isoform X2 n=1 Tax=Ipomoea nil TaxID=35883 RepID=UPI000901173D|nr:PREDICTED: transcription factor TGA7-like isoform X2 [Ipomoea nil]XP_019154841.1 PREDICTED: transcription factor TGA7-like isoform X2 [Ipomoea nil]XP_019154842.1 PREDICTED: transcription factor TGA7-like isoform X2 [Ipomoea nil]